MEQKRRGTRPPRIRRRVENGWGATIEVKGEEEPVLPPICTEATADVYSRAEGTSLLGCGRKPKLALLAIEWIRQSIPLGPGTLQNSPWPRRGAPPRGGSGLHIRTDAWARSEGVPRPHIWRFLAYSSNSRFAGTAMWLRCSRPANAVASGTLVEYLASPADPVPPPLPRFFTLMRMSPGASRHDHAPPDVVSAGRKVQCVEETSNPIRRSRELCLLQRTHGPSL